MLKGKGASECAQDRLWDMATHYSCSSPISLTWCDAKVRAPRLKPRLPCIWSHSVAINWPGDKVPGLASPAGPPPEPLNSASPGWRAPWGRGEAAERPLRAAIASGWWGPSPAGIAGLLLPKPTRRGNFPIQTLSISSLSRQHHHRPPRPAQNLGKRSPPVSSFQSPVSNALVSLL